MFVCVCVRAHVVRSFKIYSLSSILISMPHNILTYNYCSYCAIRYVFRTYSSYNWKFVPSHHFPSFLPTSNPFLWQPPICSLFPELCLFRIAHISELIRICLSLSDIFTKDSSMLLQIAGYPYFLSVFNYSWFTMFCQFLLHSKVTQIYICIYSFSHIILPHVPSQVIRYSSLCHTAGAHAYPLQMQ